MGWGQPPALALENFRQSFGQESALSRAKLLINDGLSVGQPPLDLSSLTLRNGI